MKMFDPKRNRCLAKWMHRLLRFAAGWNLVFGVFMIVAYPAIYAMLPVKTPELPFPIQLVGMMVALMGVGYLYVDRDPIQNRNILVLGALSKTLGPILAIPHLIYGTLPWMTIPLLMVADVVYLYPFWLMLKSIDSHRQNQSK